MDDLIPAEDLHVEIWPPRQVGGQHVGSGPSGVKISYRDGDLVVICNTEKSQHRNKQIAMDMLLGGLTSPHYRG